MGFHNSAKKKKNYNTKSERCDDDKTYRIRKAKQEADDKLREYEDPDTTDLVEKDCSDHGEYDWHEYLHLNGDYEDYITKEDLIEINRQQNDME